MNTMNKYPYVKAGGISLVLHAALLGVVLLFGHTMIVPASNAAPIEVEFVAASVADTGTTRAELSSPVATHEQHKQQQTVPATAYSTQQAQLQQTHANEPTVAQPPFAGVATSGIPDAVSGNTGNCEVGKKAEGPEKQSVIRTPAGYISGSRPAYPYQARQAGWEGTVVIRVLVGTDGSAAAVAVYRSSGYGALDEAAVQAVKKWRFAPARQGENPVESYFDVRVRFSLADAE